MSEVDTSQASWAAAAHELGGPRVLSGQAGGGGSVLGAARVIRAPEDFARVKPGDILVVEVARAAWLTWLSAAAGLVTEQGGILSNGAIVARELDLAVVVAAVGATTLIQDGQPLLVDGAAGLVHLRLPTG